MSRRITINIDGTPLTMLTDSPQEHIDKVVEVIDDAIKNLRKKNATLSATNVYRYVMVYLADQLVELQELVTTDGVMDNSDEAIKDLQKELQQVRSLQANWESRVSQLQELLLEKNKEIQSLKESK